MARFNVGIDTGGTYTDAVIVDLQGRAIVASAKAVTTHGDLSIGVSNALAQVLADTGPDFNRDDISLVSVSTTLATNALVEGRGAPVAAVLIGFDEGMVGRSRIAEEIPAEAIVTIAGGHDYAGQEKQVLDEASLRRSVERLEENVEAFAIASLYSIRNASHEHRAQEIISEMTGLPVTLSCELSSELDVPRRALTATLNAKIISRIVALANAIRKSLASADIGARLMIVRGDGSLAPAELVVDRPIETIMSGPAASVIGARYLSREKDFVIADIGGTTTDMATAHNGWPDTSENGSTVGGYRTMVHAVDMQTAGLGGDSEVLTDYSGGISLGSNRVVPLSLIGSRWPYVSGQLSDALATGQGLRMACRYLMLPEGLATRDLPKDLIDSDRQFLEAIGDNAVAWSSAVIHKRDQERVARLTSKGLLQIGGFTPSDAAHVLGKQSQWCSDTARLGCRVLGRISGVILPKQENSEQEIARFADLVIETVIRKSTRLLLQHLAKYDLADDDPLIAAMTSGDRQIANLGVALTPMVPVIAVGGPAGLYYPRVGERLGTSTLIPRHAEIANAIGAAVGMVRTHHSIEITGERPGRFLVHADEEPAVESTVSAALELATGLVIERARGEAQRMGAVDLTIETDVERVDLPHCSDDLSLVSATVSAVCIGRLT
jgi:N-methylhydantoinase A/oxoprolinase/acetone carboxylase beta subunit